MIRINNLTLLPVKNEDEESLINRAKNKSLKLLNIKESMINSISIKRLSIDARKKNDIFLNLVIDISLDNEVEKKLCKSNKNISQVTPFEYNPIIKEKKELKSRPVVIGAGPAGLFLAYLLSLNGFMPIIIERGKKVSDRLLDVEHFFKKIGKKY